MFKRVWEIVETKVGKIRVAKTERRREEEEEKQEEKEKKENKLKLKKEKIMEIKKVAEEWEIWNDDDDEARLEKEAKKLVPEQFHKWIKIFGEK